MLLFLCPSRRVNGLTFDLSHLSFQIRKTNCLTTFLGTLDTKQISLVSGGPTFQWAYFRWDFLFYNLVGLLSGGLTIRWAYLRDFTVYPVYLILNQWFDTSIMHLINHSLKNLQMMKYCECMVAMCEDALSKYRKIIDDAISKLDQGKVRNVSACHFFASLNN